MARNSARDRYRFDILRDGPVAEDLGAGQDEVVVRSRDKVVDQVRLTFNRSEVGDGNPIGVGAFPGADGGLAVRMQAEDAAGTAFGPVSRFDDEGITFRTQGDVKLDIRDVNTSSIGLFDVAVLGTSGAEDFDFRREDKDHYIHGGSGNDRVIGGSGNDYVIGGFGDDLVKGNDGNDTLVGGPGTDRIEGGEGNDTAVYRYNLDGADAVDLGSGADLVQVLGPPGEVRLTWSTLQTGDGNPNDGGTQTNEDGGLNIRLQAEDSGGNLTGPVSRYDDEGISFVGSPGITFDLRDLPTGVVRGNGYGIARFGSSGDDVYDDSAATVSTFSNGGAGNDTLIGGSLHDHLVGLAGNDRINGGPGNDLLVGLAGADTFIFSGAPGNDTILTYQPGTDKIDLSAYGINASHVQVAAVNGGTLIKVDSNKDGSSDFEIFLGGSVAPQSNDYIF